MARRSVSAVAGMGSTGWLRDKLEFGSGPEPEVLTEHAWWYSFEFVMVAGVGYGELAFRVGRLGVLVARAPSMSGLRRPYQAAPRRACQGRLRSWRSRSPAQACRI